MEKPKPTHVVLLTYLGEPSIKLDDQLEFFAKTFGCSPGTYSWDDTPFVRELEFLATNEKDANSLMKQVASHYNGLRHQDIYPLHEV